MELPTVEALYHYGSAISVFFVIIIPLTRMRVSAISSKRSMLYNTKFTHIVIFFFLARLSMQRDNITASNHCSLSLSLRHLSLLAVVCMLLCTKFVAWN